jgi:hypothetical protein
MKTSRGAATFAEYAMPRFVASGCRGAVAYRQFPGLKPGFSLGKNQVGSPMFARKSSGYGWLHQVVWQIQTTCEGAYDNGSCAQ